jgi:hypothetical protein
VHLLKNPQTFFSVDALQNVSTMAV